MAKRFIQGLGVCIALALSLGDGGPAVAQETKIAALKADTKAKPTDAAAAFALGRAYRRAGRFAEAKAELARAAALGKGEAAVKARYELVVAEWESGKTNPALPQPPSLAMCKQVKVGKDGEALSKVCAAEAWLTFERTGVAEDELNAAEKLDGDLYELKLARAKLAIVKGAPDDAITKLEGLTKSTPNRAEAWGLLGHQLLESGKATQAVAPLRKARELDSDWPEPFLDLARALPSGTEARDLARLAVAMRTAWPLAWLRLGQLELDTGGYEASQKAFETSIKQAPKVVAAHAGLAFALVKQKKFADARKAAVEAIGIAANHAGARLAHGEALAGLGEVDEAVEQFKFANGLDNKDPTGLFRAAEVLLDNKEPMKAAAHAEAAAKTFPDDARAWVIKGDCDLANGDKKDAKDAYKRALSAPKGTIDKAAVQKKLDAIK
ncbi:MAG: tetratricopeptide repeat protein [Deltaproteobacteria bacterium]|nr:tetratricopeptide repeat protein [Deltaproteobacteria bacterium]